MVAEIRIVNCSQIHTASTTGNTKVVFTDCKTKITVLERLMNEYKGCIRTSFEVSAQENPASINTRSKLLTTVQIEHCKE